MRRAGWTQALPPSLGVEIQAIRQVGPAPWKHPNPRPATALTQPRFSPQPICPPGPSPSSTPSLPRPSLTPVPCPPPPHASAHLHPHLLPSPWHPWSQKCLPSQKQEVADSALSSPLCGVWQWEEVIIETETDEEAEFPPEAPAGAEVSMGGAQRPPASRTWERGLGLHLPPASCPSHRQVLKGLLDTEPKPDRTPSLPPRDQLRSAIDRKQSKHKVPAGSFCQVENTVRNHYLPGSAGGR